MVKLPKIATNVCLCWHIQKLFSNSLVVTESFKLQLIIGLVNNAPASPCHSITVCHRLHGGGGGGGGMFNIIPSEEENICTKV